MSRIFTDEFKELVRQRTDLVRLIGESVGLQTRGREFVGLCPFHDDHDPSLRVYPERQTFRCWSCQTGGDCFTFVMKRESIEFREALEMLAEKANIPLPESHRNGIGHSALPPDAKSRLFEVLAWAENEFHECLQRGAVGERARRYVAERGMTEDTIRRFHIGYHPPGSQWLIDRARNRFTLDQLLAVRLIARNEHGGGYYDCFRDRIMFPIRDSQHRPVAFGGRILPGSELTSHAKYLNSSESVVFNKSRILFGLDHARDSITKADTSVLMEGYVDCIMAHQGGVTNAVATLGTALAETHVIALKRFSRKVVLVYDGDEAGKKAAERSLPKFLAHEVDLRILTLPGGIDPADYVTQHGTDRFRQLIEQAPEAWEYKFRCIRERYGLETIDARHRVLEEMLETLRQVPVTADASGAWQMRENVILGKLSHRLSIPEPLVRQRLTDLKSNVTAKPHVASRPSESTEISIQFPANPSKDLWMERELLEIIFVRPESIAAIRKQVSPSDLADARLRGLLELCFQLADRGIDPSFDRVMAAIEDLPLKAFVTQIDEHARKLTTLSSSAAIEYFQQRRELHAASAGVNGPHLPESQAGLSQDAIARLRAVTELNQKRSIKKTLT